MSAGYDTDRTILALRAELERAREKFPQNDHLFAALGEEVGELARELLEGGPRGRIREEAIQVACVAIRIAEEGDGDFPDSEPCAFPGCTEGAPEAVHDRCCDDGPCECEDDAGTRTRQSPYCHDFVSLSSRVKK